MPFEHSIAGGQGNLIAQSLQSPNFISGDIGWQVRQDGSVEFNNGVFRGTISASEFDGNDFVINSDGIFLYSGTPALGNLLIAIAQSAGTDPYGNAYTAGINSGAGNIIQNDQGFFVYDTAPTQTVTFTSSSTWTAPTGVTEANVECWGGGGGGQGGFPNSGGGGEYAAEPANTVVSGDVYTVTVGTGGAGGTGTSAGGNGGASSFSGSGAVTVTANGGHGGSGQPIGTGGAGGTGSSNTVHFNGGAGAKTSLSNPVSSGAGGCGGGSGAGTSSAGVTGKSSTGLTGAAGGSVTGGGTGGSGGKGSSSSSGAGNGSAGAAPGGGGGGAGMNGAASETGGTGGSGSPGEVRVTYTPAQPGLLATITAASGTDAYGNAFESGVTIYDGAAYLQTHVNAALAAPAIEMVTGVVSEQNHGSLYNVAANVGLANEFENVVVQGPASTFDGNSVAVILTDSARNGSSLAAGILEYNTTDMVYWDAQGLHINSELFGAGGVLVIGDKVGRSSTGFSGYPVVAQTDTTGYTVTGTSFTKVSNIWNIPANDPQVGTMYRLKVYGGGKTGSSSNVLQFQLNGFGSGAPTGELQIGSTFMANSTNFDWALEYVLMVTATGTSGSCQVCGFGAISVHGTTLISGGSNSGNATAGVAAQDQNNAMNTTTGFNITLQARWATNTGSPTINTLVNTFERLGP